MSRSHVRILVVISCLASCKQCVSADAVSQSPADASPQQKEEVVTKTHDLTRAISAHIASSEQPVREARSEAIAQLFSVPGEKRHVQRTEFRPGVYAVTASRWFHDHLEGLSKWMADGEKQITIESRIVTVSEETLRKLHAKFGPTWEMADNDGEVSTSELPSISTSKFVAPGFGVFNDNEPPAEDHVSASTSVTQSLPCRVARIAEPQLKALIDELQSDTRSNVMQAPKITMFPGQQAVVKDTTQRPFVTSVVPVKGDGATAMQPVISVLEDGLTMNLRVTVSDEDDLHVDTKISMGEIGDVEEFTFESPNQLNGTTVQIPEYLERIARISKNIRDGQSLLIDPHFFTETVIKRRFRRDITKRQFTLLVLTPRIIRQPAVTGIGKVANR